MPNTIKRNVTITTLLNGADGFVISSSEGRVFKAQYTAGNNYRVEETGVTAGPSNHGLFYTYAAAVEHVMRELGGY